MMEMFSYSRVVLLAELRNEEKKRRRRVPGNFFKYRLTGRVQVRFFFAELLCSLLFWTLFLWHKINIFVEKNESFVQLLFVGFREKEFIACIKMF
jgi:hypothetical protein